MFFVMLMLIVIYGTLWLLTGVFVLLIVLVLCLVVHIWHCAYLLRENETIFFFLSLICNIYAVSSGSFTLLLHVSGGRLCSATVELS